MDLLELQQIAVLHERGVLGQEQPTEDNTLSSQKGQSIEGAELMSSIPGSLITSLKKPPGI